MKKTILLLVFFISTWASSQVFLVNGTAAAGNTDSQQLTLAGNILTLQNGGTVNLASYLDNTDSQTVTDLSLTGSILSITLSGGNTQTVDLNTLTLQDNSVTSPKIVDGTIDEIDLDASVNASLDLADSALQSIPSGSITTTQILDGTISTLDLANGSITSDKMGVNSVVSSNISPLSVNNSHLVDGTITQGKLADNIVTSSKIVDGTIATIDLADFSVDTAKLANGAVTNVHLSPNAVTSDKINDGTIATVDYGASSITGAKILDGTIDELDLDVSVNASLDLADSALQSGSLKTVNGNNLVGAGDIAIAGGGAELQTLTQTQFNALTQPQKDAFTGYIVDVNGNTVTGVTNLTYTPSTRVIASDTGTDATITLADGTNAGLQSAANFTKQSKSIVSDIAGVTGADAINNIISLTQSEYNATTPVGSTQYIITDAAPADLLTGTALDLSGYRQYNSTPSAATEYTTTNFRTGGYVEAFINTTTEPTVTGATKLPNTAAWVTGVDMLLCVKALGNATVKYFFVRL